jgi:hypothetical protein
VGNGRPDPNVTIASVEGPRLCVACALTGWPRGDGLQPRLAPNVRHHMRTIAVLFPLLVALSLLPRNSAAQSESTFVQSMRCVGGPYGLLLPTDARKLRKLKKVPREEISEVEEEDGYTATRKTIYFSGMSLGIVEFSNDASRLIVTFAEITSPEWNRISPFKLRRPVSEAQASLGEVAATDPHLKKSYGSEGDSLQIQSSNSIVTSVSYSCYSG